MFTLPETTDERFAAAFTGTVAVWGGRWAAFRAAPRSVVRLAVTQGRSRRGAGTRYYIAGVLDLYDLTRAPSRRCRSDAEALAWANEWAEKHRLSERLPLACGVAAAA